MLVRQHDQPLRTTYYRQRVIFPPMANTFVQPADIPIRPAHPPSLGRWNIIFGYLLNGCGRSSDVRKKGAQKSQQHQKILTILNALSNALSGSNSFNGQPGQTALFGECVEGKLSLILPTISDFMWCRTRVDVSDDCEEKKKFLQGKIQNFNGSRNYDKCDRPLERYCSQEQDDQNAED